jgi:hypothetical protein
MHLTKHAHGKSRVRVARVWREGAVHHAVEWQCEVLLESDMAPAYLRGDNSDMTATDTIKNTVRIHMRPTRAPADPLAAKVYHVAKQQRKRCSAEEFGVALAEHFLAEHPKARPGVTPRGQRAREPLGAARSRGCARRAGVCRGSHGRAEAVGAHQRRRPAPRSRHVLLQPASDGFAAIPASA